MALYCRYCGEEMKQPKEAFCYKCHKEGSAVDFFYRKIKEQNKLTLIEDEQDFLRSDGSGIIVCAVIMELCSLFLPAFDIYSRLTGGEELLPLPFIIFFGIGIVFFAYAGIIGFQMYTLNRKFFKAGLRLHILVLKIFFSFIHTVFGHNRQGRRYFDSLHSIPNIKKKMKPIDYTAYLIDKLANGEENAAEQQWQHIEEKPKNKEADPNKWRCDFCRYYNKYSDYRCRSCGKERSLERR